MKNILKSFIVIMALPLSWSDAQELTGIICKILPNHGEVSLRKEADQNWILRFSHGHWNEPLDHQFTEMLLKLGTDIKPSEDVESADFYLRKGCHVASSSLFDLVCESFRSVGMIPFRDQEQNASRVIQELLNAEITLSIQLNQAEKYAMKFYIKEGDREWEAKLALGNCHYLYRAN